MSVASGVARPEMSGIISSIADQARKLEATSSVNPVIRLESDQGLVKVNIFALLFVLFNYIEYLLTCIEVTEISIFNACRL